MEIQIFDAAGTKVEREGVTISIWADGRPAQTTGLRAGDVIRCGDVIVWRET